jgi:hypothetical protein
VKEAELGSPRLMERGPVGPCRLEQAKCADDVGIDKGGGRVDRTVDVRFGREVDNGPGPMLVEQGGD